MTLFWSKSTIISLPVWISPRNNKKTEASSFAGYYTFIWRFLTVSCSTLIFEQMQICVSNLYMHAHTHAPILWLVGSVWERRVQQSQTGHRKRPGSTNQQQWSTNPISQTDRLCSRKAKWSWMKNKPRGMRLFLITMKLPLSCSYDRSEWWSWIYTRSVLFRLAERQYPK